MDPFIYGLYSLFYLFLFLWGLKLSINNRQFSLINVLLLVTFGLLYDNCVLAFGSLIGEGNLLKGLNLTRYWIHAIITPTIILFSWSAVRNAGVDWLDSRAGFITSALLTAALIVWELVSNTVGIVVEPTRKYGVLSYEPVQTQGPSVMVIGVSVILLLAGMILWKKLKWKWMAIGVIIMSIGSLVSFPVNSEAIVNGFELILIFSLLATKAFLERRRISKADSINDQ